MSYEQSVTEYLIDLKNGDDQALEKILPIVYGELRRLADGYLKNERAGHTLQPTALVHEVYLRMLGQKNITSQNRAHFFGIAARVMREVLIDYARWRNRLKRGGNEQTRIAIEAISFDNRPALDVINVNEALGKLEKLDARQAQIVEMIFFGGLKIEEIGEVLNISPATVKREWSSAKLILRKIIDE
jgi:RNA polymerase sigma-70 factor, ECF subfamily